MTTIDASRPATSSPTLRQQAWLDASPEQRIRISERLGEDGARALAKAKGYEPLCDGFGRTLPQGPDQIYRVPADGRVIVYEAKGGLGQLGHAYGHPQGSTEWAVAAAKRVLRSSKASPAENAGAKAILEAASVGKLEVHVVRTKHVLCEPTAAVLQQTSATTDEAARLARAALDEIASAGAVGVEAGASSGAKALDGAANSAFKVAEGASGSADAALAGTTSAGGNVLKGVAKVAVPVAVGIDLDVRAKDAIDVEDSFSAGEITQQQREVAHAKNAAGFVGGWGGAVAGAEAGAIAGGAAGTCVEPGLGTAIGAGLGGAAGGIAGYFGGEAAAEAAAEWTVTTIHNTGTTISDTATTGWDATAGAATASGDAVGRAWHWVRGD